MFLNAEKHRALVDMIDGLVHESAHANLFSLSLGDPFVANKDDEFYHSPLRSDPRPLDDIFHATYVSARLHYVHQRLIESRVLSDNEKDVVQSGLSVSRGAFWEGFKTLDAHASLTSLGSRVMHDAHDYMIGHA